MSRGSAFIAALLAVILFKMMARAPHDTPIWYDYVAALGGTVIVWVMDRGVTALRQSRRRRRALR